VRLLLLALDLRLEEDHAECIHVREVALNLAAMGHQILLLASSESTWIPPERSTALSVRAVGGGSTVSELLTVLAEARWFRPEVVYERRFLPKISAALSLLGTPSAVEINGLVEDEITMQGRTVDSIFPPGLRELAFGFIFGRMKRVVTVTTKLAEEMHTLYGVPLQRLIVIENGANTQLFRALDKRECRRLRNLPPDGAWLCFVGGLFPWHGVETVIQALKLLRANRVDANLLVVGDGPARQTLESLVHAEGLDDRVRFVGRVPYAEVASYVCACDLGVAPLTRARNERIGSSPMKVYEYVACGRPVIVSHLATVGEWVLKEGVGDVAEPDNPQDFAKKIQALLADASLLTSMPRKGPDAVSRNHTWSSVAQKIADICEFIRRPTI
jgi:glycosyltransferase involved in cell wall biosynthesis